MRIFEIETPDGRLLRQNHPSLDHVKNHLLPHYVVRGEVFGADSRGNGGLLDRFDGEPLMAQLLTGRNGEYLRDWLKGENVYASVKIDGLQIAKLIEKQVGASDAPV